MGETRVDLQHLLEDLRDAYTGSLEETILTEVVANALDSGATRVLMLTDAAAATLTIIDDGRGMQRRELVRYHDIAASSKQRGEGIGFAGVGIKLGLLVSRCDYGNETRGHACRDSMAPRLTPSRAVEVAPAARPHRGAGDGGAVDARESAVALA